MINPFSFIDRYSQDLSTLEAELQTGLKRFWSAAATTLEGSTIQLIPPDQAMLSLANNFFSTLFLYSYYRSDIPSERRILYAAVNQCLRGMVTGCDNLLDDEYKVTLKTDLPQQAHRFRSVLDIMVADRVLFTLLSHHCSDNGLPAELAVQACNTSLQALALSGKQEASEEGGISERLIPGQILSDIHHYKTGILFQSTWAIPCLFENKLSQETLSTQQALYQIGIGCQLLDDITDLFTDLQEHRHNYVASVIFHEEPQHVRDHLQAAISANQPQTTFYVACPDLVARMRSKAMTTLEQGLGGLFLDRHQQAIRPAAAFIAQRIGVDPC
jgi:hypothetical protein